MLLFIDNIFRFVQAGRRCPRCSAACRAPSGTSRRSPPRWASSRSASRQRAPARSRRCRRSTCRPTTSPTRLPRTPSPTSTPTSRSRPIVEKESSPRSTRSTPRPAPSSPARSRDDHYETTTPCGGAPALPRPAGHHRHPRHRGALRRGQAHRAARPQGRAVPVPADVRRRAVHGAARRVRQARETIAGFQAILDGEHDELPEQAFYMVGTIDDAVKKGRELDGEEPQAAGAGRGRGPSRSPRRLARWRTSTARSTLR